VCVFGRDDRGRRGHRVDRRGADGAGEREGHDDGGHEDEGQLQLSAGTHRFDLPSVLRGDEDRAISGSRT
jgi:hypothetical protein